MSDETVYVATLNDDTVYELDDLDTDVLATGYALLHGNCSDRQADILRDHVETLAEHSVTFTVDLSNAMTQDPSYILVELPSYGGIDKQTTAIPVNLLDLLEPVATKKAKPINFGAPILPVTESLKSPAARGFSPSTIKSSKETKPMFKKPDLSQFANVLHGHVTKMFCQVDNVLLDFQTNQLGIVGSDGSIITAKVADGALVPSSNPIALFATPVPAFAFRKKLSEVKVGDIVILENKEPAFVSAVSGGEIKVLKGNETAGTLVPIASTMFGSGILVVQSFFGDSGQINPMFLMLMAGDNDSGLKDMLPFMLMSQGGDMGKMLPFMLMSGSSGSGDMLHAMVMMQMLGGSAGKEMAGFGDMFGGMFGAKA